MNVIMRLSRNHSLSKFAEVAMGPFATLGFNLTAKVLNKEITPQEKNRELIMFGLTYFGDENIGRQFLDFVLPEWRNLNIK